MKFKIAFAMLIALTFIMGGCANGPAAGSGGLNTLSSNPAVPTPAPVPDGVIADSVSGRFALYDGSIYYASSDSICVLEPGANSTGILLLADSPSRLEIVDGVLYYLAVGQRDEYFSPLSDAEPPKNTDGFLFCGGYPELHAEELSENQTMRTKIRDNIRQGMPVLAECGGYMYLSESMEDMDGNVYPMVQAVPGNVYRTKKLGRFGYITLTPNTKDTFRNGGNPVRGHEFHYFDSTDCASAWHAAKPLRKRNWECIHATKRMMAGFPHLYYMASPHLALEFLEQCVSYRKEQEKTR